MSKDTIDGIVTAIFALIYIFLFYICVSIYVIVGDRYFPINIYNPISFAVVMMGVIIGGLVCILLPIYIAVTGYEVAIDFLNSKELGENNVDKR